MCSENKGADQLRSYCAADLQLCIRMHKIYSLIHAATQLYFQNGEILNDVYEHSKQINDLQMSLDMSMLISASKDTTAKVSDRLSPLDIK